jgi:hypothetical protein
MLPARSAGHSAPPGAERASIAGTVSRRQRLSTRPGVRTAVGGIRELERPPAPARRGRVPQGSRAGRSGRCGHRPGRRRAPRPAAATRRRHCAQLDDGPAAFTNGSVRPRRWHRPGGGSSWRLDGRVGRAAARGSTGRRAGAEHRICRGERRRRQAGAPASVDFLGRSIRGNPARWTSGRVVSARSSGWARSRPAGSSRDSLLRAGDQVAPRARTERARAGDTVSLPVRGGAA